MFRYDYIIAGLVTSIGMPQNTLHFEQEVIDKHGKASSHDYNDRMVMVYDDNTVNQRRVYMSCTFLCHRPTKARTR